MTNDSNSSRSNWVLVISKAGDTPRTVPFEPDLVFGRSSRSSCVLQDPTVSGSHARIIDQDGAPAIEDLGSENGTQIQGGQTLMKGQTCLLVPGMTMRLGETFVALRDDAASAAPVQAVDDDATMIQAGAGAKGTPAGPGGETAEAPAPANEQESATVQESAPAQKPAPVQEAPAVKDPTPTKEPAPLSQASHAPPSSVHPDLPASHVSSITDSSAYEGTIDFGPGGIDGLNAKIAAEGNLRAARARIVLASQVDRRVDSIEDVDFVIGRGKTARCRITHPAISTPHAGIRFDMAEKRFMLHDENSKNHTYLNGRLVNHGSPQELLPESHLRFGPVDALFVTEIDVDGVKIPNTRQHFAAQILAESGAITQAQRIAVVQDSKDLGKHVGEALLLASDPITVKQWVDAMEQARYLEIRTGFERKFNPRWIAFGIIAALVILLLLVAF